MLPWVPLAALTRFALAVVFALLLRAERLIQKLLLLAHEIREAVEPLQIFPLFLRVAAPLRSLQGLKDIAELVQHLLGRIGRPGFRDRPLLPWLR